MATGTNNPPGSDNPLDLRANAQNLDLLLLGPNASYPSRLGVQKRSWAGIDAAYDAAEDNRDALFQAKLATTGYELPSLPYAAGLTIVRETQLIERLGEFYRAKAGVVPFVTTGVWATDELNLVAVGDAVLRQELAADNGASLIDYKGRTQYEVNGDRVSVKDAPWSAKGDAVTDDTAAIAAADLYCAQNGLTLFFPRGVYRTTDGIESFADWQGVGSPSVSPFALVDDKQFLVAGQRTKLPGSCILFQGSASAAFTTLRGDQFGSMTYVVKKTGRSVYRSAPAISDMGIILDFDFKDGSGNVTLPNNDNSAIADVGLLLHNVEMRNIRNVCVGGYYQVSGTVHFGIDPDNTHAFGLKTMGDYGLAIIGDTTGTNSGFNAIGCFIGANDHHSRSVNPVNERWGKGALYIDIPSSGGTGSRNGISFIGGAVTTKTNTPMVMDRCGAINFTNVVFENANQAGSGTGSGQAGGPKKFIGTTETGDIGFLNCRLNAEQIKNTGALLNTAPNATITIVGGNENYGLEVWHGLSGIRMSAGTEQNFQLTNDPASVTTGVRLRRTAAGTLEMTIDNTRVMAWGSTGIQFSKDRSVSATISANAVSISSNVVRLIGGTTDLSTITPSDGLNKVRLLANTSGDIITLKTTGGNIRIGTDYVLSGFKVINLYYDGTFWLQDGGRQ